MPPTFRTHPDLVQGVMAGGYDALLRAQEGDSFTVLLLDG